MMHQRSIDFVGRKIKVMQLQEAFLWNKNISFEHLMN